MNLASTVFPVLVGIASSSVLMAAVKAFANRKKVDADATEVLARSAVAQVISMQGEVTGYRADIRQLRKDLAEHRKWDYMVYRELSEHRSDVPLPPELWV